MKYVLAVFLFLGIAGIAPTAGASDFDAIIQQAKAARQPVLIDFGSGICIPCRKMAPTLKKLEEEYKGRMPVLFVDVRVHAAFPAKYGIYSIPTQVYLDKSGKEVHRHIGYAEYREIKALLKKVGM